MFEKVLLAETRNLLRKLKSEDLPADSYLAGGTAVALYLGHRRSADLDFFTPSEFLETQWENKIQHDLGFVLIKRDWQTLIGTIDRVKFSLFGYHYPEIGTRELYGNVQVASLPDLAAMKLDTIIGRGSKRDFIDIYFLTQRFSLNTLFSFYQAKYGNFEERQLMLKKALVYFSDADKEENPDMINPIQWSEIKKAFQKNILKNFAPKTNETNNHPPPTS
jgi:predicted nucleotidyltransferase component of viral defense system